MGTILFKFLEDKLLKLEFDCKKKKVKTKYYALKLFYSKNKHPTTIQPITIK